MVNKITSPITPLGEINKINEVIDQVNTNTSDIAGKQATLVSGTNIKTINNTSLLGSGNIDIQGGGGTTEYVRNIGEIVTSTIPLTDAGLHLLDGALLSGSGSYADFVTYIAGLVSDYPDLFDTEANWQSAVTTYGVCGKFVYNSVANTVRLPKITGFIEGTADVTALGDLIEAGLPNVSCSSTGSDNISNRGTAEAPFYKTNTTTYQVGGSGSANSYITGFNLSLANSIYGNSTTVQPQAIKVLYYIVVATITKTEIEVDIDEIATDLNGKADTDLSNASPTSAFATAMNTAGIRTVVETYVNGTSWYRIYSDNWCEQGGTKTKPNSTKVSVTMLQSFRDTNYSVFIADRIAGNMATAPSFNITATNKFEIYQNNGASVVCYWQACGYIS